MIFYLSTRSVSWAPTVCGELSATAGGDRCVTGTTLNPVTVNTHHPHTHSPMHTQAHTHPHSHIHSHTCAITNAHSCSHSHIHAHTHTFPTLLILTLMLTYLHTYIHTCSRSPIHTRTHTVTLTHILPSSSQSWDRAEATEASQSERLLPCPAQQPHLSPPTPGPALSLLTHTPHAIITYHKIKHVCNELWGMHNICRWSSERAGIDVISVNSD